MHIETKHINIKEGFWYKRQNINKQVTIKAVQNRFLETGRFDALDFDNEKIPHIFYDSDVAKWIEGVSFTLYKERNTELEKFIDHLIDLIEKNRSEDGYFNSHFLRKPEERWKNREDHELYCAGHLMEAAVEYYKATGKDKFLKLMQDYADYIYKVFVIEDLAAFKTPGHEEIELALVKLYDVTENKKYLELSKYFIDTRGTIEEPYILEKYNHYNIQDHLPVRQQKTAEGHSVRASYLYSGMADIAVKYNDTELFEACKTIFSNIVNKRMYITGGTGSSHLGEAFTLDYDLPNSKGYAETCAAIALAFFAQRMLLLEKDSVYADTVERVMYNGMLSGISLDGKAFFYENPLEIQPVLNKRNVSTTFTERNPITQRKEVFSCSCCPPNVIRFIGAINGYIYSYEQDILFINQYISSEMLYENIQADMKTDFPSSGNVSIKTKNINQIAIRKPYWCTDVDIKVNGNDAIYTLEKGYMYLGLTETNNTIDIKMDMPVRIVRSNPKVHEDSKKTAVMRGPIVYCAEGIDNNFPLNQILFSEKCEYKVDKSNDLDADILKLKVKIPKEIDELYTYKPFEYIDKELTLIPFYCFANRGETEMRVWL